MKQFVSLSLLVASLALVGCGDLVQENPNQQTTDTFWLSEADARAGLNAAYQGLQNNGTYGRWLTFAYDIRSDIGSSASPWTELSNFNKFTIGSYDFEVNAAIWNDHYLALFRANQVIANTPGVDMNENLKARFVAEARFLRALEYFNLVTLFGDVPLVTAPSVPEERPAQATSDQVWAFIEEDLKAAQAALPPAYGADEAGRATSGAATALLAKAYLQQRKWSQAAEAFQQVISSPAGYDLLARYEENFDGENENDRESVFEVQFTDNARLSTGARGNNIPRMIGPCGVGFCDANPTRWYFNEFFKEKTADGKQDPRLNATIFWNDPDGMDVFGQSFKSRYGDTSDRLFWKKYSEYWLSGQDWDSAINFKVIRFADVLLMYAEALNELGRTQEAYAPINRVRARVGLAPLAPGLSQQAMRDQLAHERVLELGLEQTRWHFLQRQGLLSAASLPMLRAHDDEFSFFVNGKSERLPIPQAEVDLNPNVSQNPGW